VKREHFLDNLIDVLHFIRVKYFFFLSQMSVSLGISTHFVWLVSKVIIPKSICVDLTSTTVEIDTTATATATATTE
jgi:hypothetical protein